MPLDTGAVAEFDRLASIGKDRLPRPRGGAPLDDRLPLGEALRGARRAAGLTVADIARATRVRPSHVEALENLDFDALPSRPFTVGYLRAYANVLGLDEDRAVGRFRAESPEIDGGLRGPGGIGQQAPRRFRWLALFAALIAVAVLGWNFSRHALASPAHPNHAILAAATRHGPAQGPAHLGAPLPAPPEATTPAVYETPGLAAAVAGDSRAPAKAAAQAPVTGALFVPAGAIYGAPKASADIVFQARNATSLVVRGKGGAVYFARQLETGEAWRAPASPGLIVDAGNPASVEVYVAGVSRGRLTEGLTPLSQFGG